MKLQISSGRGPLECERAVFLFYKKYLSPLLREAEITEKIISSINGEEKECFKSLTLDIKVDEKSAVLKRLGNLCGTIQWICTSPYRKEHRRKNWFINVNLLDENEEITFHENELAFELSKSSGPGGQNRNKVETAVKVIHRPTGINATATEERSQRQNREKALERLKHLFLQQNALLKQKEKDAQWSYHNLLVRGNPTLIFKGKNFKLLK